MKLKDERAQGSQLLLLMLLMLMIFFIFGNPAIAQWLAVSMNALFYPVIGFSGDYPVLTLMIAGVIVVFLSSFFHNLFTDWVKMGRIQETSRAFQKELVAARKSGNTKKVNKLMKMQPEIMRKQTEASGGMMKPMIFLFIFIVPIFMWLRYFLGNLSYFYFTAPWADTVSFFSRPFPGEILMQAWLWLYLIFSIVLGQVMRQGLKWISWSEWWKRTKKRISPSSQ
jgi:uncharacterized membrane protein (DUF106 family)